MLTHAFAPPSLSLRFHRRMTLCHAHTRTCSSIPFASFPSSHDIMSCSHITHAFAPPSLLLHILRRAYVRSSNNHFTSMPSGQLLHSSESNVAAFAKHPHGCKHSHGCSTHTAAAFAKHPHGCKHSHCCSNHTAAAYAKHPHYCKHSHRRCTHTAAVLAKPATTNGTQFSTTLTQHKRERSLIPAKSG